MPGPGPHLLYALGTGSALMQLTAGRFSGAHCLLYAINSFIGPDIGSFFEWLTQSTAPSFGSGLMSIVHNPFLFALFPAPLLALLYKRLGSKLAAMNLLNDKVTASFSLPRVYAIIVAGGISHFFLDNLFEQNGHTQWYTWVLSTGTWTQGPHLEAVSLLVIALLILGALAGFTWLNWPMPTLKGAHPVDQSRRPLHTCALLAGVATVYAAWCAICLYGRENRVPPLGEEADLGVIVFLALFFFLPHGILVLSVKEPRAVQHNRDSLLPSINLPVVAKS